jgi:hypothetical protein
MCKKEGEGRGRRRGKEKEAKRMRLIKGRGKYCGMSADAEEI